MLDWITIQRMSALSKSAIYLLILTLAAAPLANSAVDCDVRQAQDAGGRMITTEAHHDHAVSAVAEIAYSLPGSDLRKHSDDMNDSASMNCCDDCIVFCTVAGGISVATASSLLDFAFDGHDRLSAASVDPRQDPHSRSLFRPPIPYL